MWHEVFIVLAFCCGVMTSLTTLSVLASDPGRGSTVKHRVFFFASFVSPMLFCRSTVERRSNSDVYCTSVKKTRSWKKKQQKSMKFQRTVEELGNPTSSKVLFALCASARNPQVPLVTCHQKKKTDISAFRSQKRLHYSSGGFFRFV